MATKDLTGKRFGKLLVVKKLDVKQNFGGYKYLCKCDCGNEKIVYSGDLNRTTRTGTRSCGCLSKRPFGEASFQRVLHLLKKQASERNYEWNLTEEQVRSITSSPCFYCGTSPCQVQVNDFNNGDYVYNGIDRVDNSRGYSIDNVVPCCGRCNHAKSDYSINDFGEWVTKVFSHWVSTSGYSHD